MLITNEQLVRNLILIDWNTTNNILCGVWNQNSMVTIKKGKKPKVNKYFGKFLFMVIIYVVLK